MLDTIRRIIQEVNAASNLKEALDLIVHRVKSVMNSQVCSVYLTDYENQENVLMASNGLNQQAVGKVRLKFNEGLVGLIAEKAEAINLDNAPLHPAFHYLPITQEEQFKAFLGAPIVHHRKVLGVIVVQQIESRLYDEEELTLLFTIAAQLAGAIAHADAVGEISGLHNHTANKDKPFKGLAGASGVAIGTSVVIYPSADLDAVPNRITDDIEGELLAFNSAVEATREELHKLKERVSQLPTEEQMLFDAYLLMLESKTLIDKTTDRIKSGYWASSALRDTVIEHVKLFSSMDDDYLSERAQDIRDLGRRILMHIQAKKRGTQVFKDKTILIGDEISPSVLMEVPEGNLAGVVSRTGSGSSHVAILARALNVPAVMGVSDLPINFLDNKLIVVDGYEGNIYIEPSQHIVDEFVVVMHEETELANELSGLKDLPTETTDGVRVPLMVNSGLLSDLSGSKNSGAEGIGLYRTEFPFMIRDRFPGEEEQTKIYRKILESISPNPVTLRTLDIGGDKNLTYFPIKEENPFLGWRGIRVSLDHPDIFVTQLKAMLRASEGLDNLNILLPMISCISEVNESLALLQRARDELIDRGFTNLRLPRVGAMIEVPSAVYQASLIAKRVDFLSIGTNDLVQYILAVDRNNPDVAELYDCLHPAIIQAVKLVIRSAESQKIPVSVCGEMAGDPAAVILLLGMGINVLSMSVVALPRIKWVIRNFSYQQAAEILAEVENFEEAIDVRRYLNNELDKAGLGGLIRPGKH